MKNKLLLIAVVCAAIASGCEKNDTKTDKLDQFKQTIENQRRHQHDGRRYLADFAKAARRRRDRRHRLQHLLEQRKHQQQTQLDNK